MRKPVSLIPTMTLAKVYARGLAKQRKVKLQFKYMHIEGCYAKGCSQFTTVFET
jgi:hypothetical protein